MKKLAAKAIWPLIFFGSMALILYIGHLVHVMTQEPMGALLTVLALAGIGKVIIELFIGEP